MVSEPMTIFIIAQAVAILSTLVTIFVKLNNKLTKISTNLEHLETRRSEQREDHDKLGDQVQGISRTVERHDAILKANSP